MYSDILELRLFNKLSTVDNASAIDHTASYVVDEYFDNVTPRFANSAVNSALVCRKK